MLRTLVAALVFSLYGQANAGLISPQARTELMQQALIGFWGRSKTPDEQVIQPANERERKAPPVNQEVVDFAFDVGELSGLSEWCSMDWKLTFTALMRSARRNGLNEKQVAFVSVLHGTAQGAVASAMEKSGPCNQQYRDKLRSQVEGFLSKEPK